MKYGLIIFAFLAWTYGAIEYGSKKTEAQNNEDISKIVEKALLDQQEEIKSAFQKNEILEQEADTNKERIRKLRARVGRPVGACIDVATVGLLNDAVRDKALHPARDTAVVIEKGGTITDYCLSNIGQYNAIAVQVNHLIDEVNNR